jgi:hypothetical protein
MSSTTVILYASGRSRSKIDEALAAYPDAHVWTVNARRHPRATLHFDIHYSRPQTDPNPAVPCIVSPFAGTLQSNWHRFPLGAAVDLGEPFFELTHDYLLAFAYLAHGGVLPEVLHGNGVPRCIDQIFFCGVDCDDKHHFDQSRGIHFWMGMLRAQGVQLIRYPSASMCIRRVHPGRIEPSTGAPHFYGQPGETAEAWLRSHQASVLSVSSVVKR